MSESRCISISRPNARDESRDSTITIARPAAIADSQKIQGSAGEYQSG